MFKNLRFAKPVDLWRNSEPIPPLLPNNLPQIPEKPDPVESSLLQETVQETNELTHRLIVEGARQGTPMDQETFVALTNLRAPFKDEEDYALAE